MEPGTVLRNICQLLLIRKQILSNSKGTPTEPCAKTAAENKIPNKGKNSNHVNKRGKIVKNCEKLERLKVLKIKIFHTALIMNDK